VPGPDVVGRWRAVDLLVRRRRHAGGECCPPPPHREALSLHPDDDVPRPLCHVPSQRRQRLDLREYSPMSGIRYALSWSLSDYRTRAGSSRHTQPQPRHRRPLIPGTCFWRRWLDPLTEQLGHRGSAIMRSSFAVVLMGVPESPRTNRSPRRPPPRAEHVWPESGDNQGATQVTAVAVSGVKIGFMAEGEGFEPPGDCSPVDFKTHSPQAPSTRPVVHLAS